jgi:hypothetical protein
MAEVKSDSAPSFFRRRCRLDAEYDNPVESLGTGVKGDNAVIRLDEAPCHWKTHVAQTDKSDLHSDRLALAGESA